MTEYIATDQLLKELLEDVSLDERQQTALKAIFARKLTLPKQHREAVGLAYYGALSGAEPWATVNGTGTLIALLITSIRDAGNDRMERDLIEKEHAAWAQAMAQYSTKDDDSQKFRAAANCQRILGTLGFLAYKYGNMPSGGFKIPIPATTGAHP